MVCEVREQFLFVYEITNSFCLATPFLSSPGTPPSLIALNKTSLCCNFFDGRFCTPICGYARGAPNPKSKEGTGKEVGFAFGNGQKHCHHEVCPLGFRTNGYSCDWRGVPRLNNPIFPCSSLFVFLPLYLFCPFTSISPSPSRRPFRLPTSP